MNSQPGFRESTPSNHLVRCLGCSSPILTEVSRCPYCGLRLSGKERAVTRLELLQQIRARSAMKISRWCDVCGKAIHPESKLCANCSASRRHRMKIAMVVVSFVIVFAFARFLLLS